MSPSPRIAGSVALGLALGLPVASGAAADENVESEALVERCWTVALTHEEVEAGETSEITCETVPESAPFDHGPLATLAVHWDGFGGTGASLTVTGSSCAGRTLNFNVYDWWNNRISSTQFSSCGSVKHWTGASFTGDNQLVQGSAGQVANMNATLNNHTSSVEYG